MNTEILLIVNIVLGLALIGLCIYLLGTLKKIRSLRIMLADGAYSSNLEDILAVTASKIKKLEKVDETLQHTLESVSKLVENDMRGVGVHKFNAFSDEGGNLSFTLALLNTHHSGFVLSSIYGRSNNRIYIKSIVSGQSTGELTIEEQKAISAAKEQIESVNKYLIK